LIFTLFLLFEDIIDHSPLYPEDSGGLGDIGGEIFDYG
jgi:hypothetical protein